MENQLLQICGYTSLGPNVKGYTYSTLCMVKMLVDDWRGGRLVILTRNICRRLLFEGLE